MFQSTHPRGVRLAVQGSTDHLQLFQSTHPRGVRLAILQIKKCKSKSFNPRTHEGCDKCPVVIVFSVCSFNPRTHEGCDIWREQREFNRQVSIHAPTRGATYDNSFYWSCSGFQSTHPRGVRLNTIVISNSSIMFQSTHPRGVRQLNWLMSKRVVMFQSTHPRGVRPFTYNDDNLPIFVSIHAPTRGATIFKATQVNYNNVSIHAPTRGATVILVFLALLLCFNPRTHEGCDLILLQSNSRAKSFNPRTHEGCDFNALLSNTADIVSIHAPTRGATQKSVNDSIIALFQSTHPRGVRRKNTSIKRLCSSFNPRTHEGCDLSSHLKTLSKRSFNPRTHEGCDFYEPGLVKAMTQFQSTHPRGVRLKVRFFAIGEYGFNPRTHEGCDTERKCLTRVE